jgi:hypothetical protein
MVGIDLMARRLRQVHRSLSDLADGDPASVATRVSGIDGAQLWETDFSGEFDDAKLHNVAELLVANIGTIKDHLAKWCSATGSTFSAESVLNNGDAAAVVHDLWNSQKHGGLTKPPRSGYHPSLKNIHRAMSIAVDPLRDGSVVVAFAPGQPQVHRSGAGAATVVIDAQIVDEHGVVRGHLLSTCREAIEIWESALTAAGVSLPQPLATPETSGVVIAAVSVRGLPAGSGWTPFVRVSNKT